MTTPKQDPWCTTCEHTHIPEIPAVTYRCHHCGWGQWTEDLAAEHRAACPGHETYPVEHHLINWDGLDADEVCLHGRPLKPRNADGFRDTDCPECLAELAAEMEPG